MTDYFLTTIGVNWFTRRNIHFIAQIICVRSCKEPTFTDTTTK